MKCTAAHLPALNSLASGSPAAYPSCAVLSTSISLGMRVIVKQVRFGVQLQISQAVSLELSGYGHLRKGP